MINHPFGTGFYQLSMVMTGGWFMIVVPTLETQILKWNFSYATHTHTHTIAAEDPPFCVSKGRLGRFHARHGQGIVTS